MTVPTPWEAAGRPEYNYGTAPALEDAFLTGIEAASDRIGLAVIGETVEGRPLRVVRVGATTPPPLAAHPRSMLYVGGQHGNEGSPPEALFKLIRDLAETTDPNLLDYLDRTPLFIIPNLN